MIYIRSLIPRLSPLLSGESLGMRLATAYVAVVMAYVADASIQAGSVYAVVCLDITVLVLPTHHTTTVIVVEQILEWNRSDNILFYSLSPPPPSPLPFLRPPLLSGLIPRPAPSLGIRLAHCKIH